VRLDDEHVDDHAEDNAAVQDGERDAFADEASEGLDLGRGHRDARAFVARRQSRNAVAQRPDHAFRDARLQQVQAELERGRDHDRGKIGCAERGQHSKRFGIDRRVDDPALEFDGREG
jgi:hypothetical protein